MAYLFKLLYIVAGTHPNLFYTNTHASAEPPSVCVTEPAKCGRYLARERKVPRELVRCREGPPQAAYLLKRMEALPERLTCTIELAKDLCAALSDVLLRLRGTLRRSGSL